MAGLQFGFGSQGTYPLQQTPWGISPYGSLPTGSYQPGIPLLHPIVQSLQIVAQQLQQLQQLDYLQLQQLQQLQQWIQVVPQQIQQLQQQLLNQSPTPQSFGFGMTPDSYAYGLPLNSLAFAGSPIVTAPALLAATALRRGQPTGPANDQEIEDFLYDAFELLTGTNEVEVRCEGGRVTLTGSVPHKRLKRDVGEIVWA